MALGPQEIGDTRQNRLVDIIGRVWAFLFCDDGSWHVLQWVGTDDLDPATGLTSRGWLEVTVGIPSLPELTPGVQSRFSLAFDQSARAVVAYEEAGQVKVTRWDAALGQYVQNVTFAGRDPVVVFDATWAYDIPVSDVLVFYLDAATRSRLMVRVQRDLYAVEYELHDYGQPVVLDRVVRLPLRYQVLASDAQGDPLEDAGERFGLLSDLYPYPWTEALEAPALPPAAGTYTLVVLTHDAAAETLEATASPPASGVYADRVIEYASEAENLAGAAIPAASGDYIRVIIGYEPDLEGVDGAAAPMSAGEYTLVVIPTEYDGDPGISGAAAPPAGGTYDPA